MIYFALALIFGTAHHFWANRFRHRIAKYIAEHTPRLSPDSGNHIQNWFVRVFLPSCIVLSQGKTPEALGFRLPHLTFQVFFSIVVLTVGIPVLSVVVIWFAISVAKDQNVISNVKGWSKKKSWKGSLIGSLLWTVPEECFLRGYLISQFSRFDLILALLLSAFFTAVLHESRGRFWVLLSVFTGIFFGIAFIWTYSLLPPFIMHAVCNELFTTILAPWTAKLIQKTC